MGRRHTNKALQIDSSTVIEEVTTEMFRANKKHGGFNSSHELYAVLLEEVEEFWDSLKESDPDPMELIQVAAVAIRGALYLCELGRLEERSESARFEAKYGCISDNDSC